MDSILKTAAVFIITKEVISEVIHHYKFYRNCKTDHYAVVKIEGCIENKTVDHIKNLFKKTEQTCKGILLVVESGGGEANASFELEKILNYK